MCGICGSVRLRSGTPPIDLDAFRRTRDFMARRGPDGVGEWLSPDGRVALGHRRLAILDLSPAGAQPMVDPSGRLRIVFNGEIYNFRELRADLERDGDRFTTQSDTEVLLALWAREGARSLSRLRGMFALAVHDSRDGCVTLARDPFGMKPLYFELRPGELRFASQVRALEAGGASLELDPGGLAGFLLWGSVPEPRTIRRSIRAVPAGSFVEVRDGEVGEPRPIGEGDEPEPAFEDVAGALGDSIRAHLVSDVPIAVFLSSGLDSTTIAALAATEQRRAGNSEPLATFTVAFEGWQGSSRDEAPLAALVAAALGTRHAVRRLSRDDVAKSWSDALVAMDQPSIDGFNSFVVARAAHEQGIKVALSGLGGDELFGSYPSFRDVPAWTSRARLLRAVPGARAIWPRLARTFAPNRPKLRSLAEHGGELAGAYFLRRGLFLPEELPGMIGAERASAGLEAHDPVAYAAAVISPSCNGSSLPSRLEYPQSEVRRLEQCLYMRNQLLRDADWAAMASSVEVRLPLVDRPLWRAFTREPLATTRRSGKAALLRDVVAKLGTAFPDEIWGRPKSGFAVPIADWMVPAADAKGDTAGKGSRRIALALLQEWGVV
jgi:asparagine synthase (glutamine-hydrolysing)